MPVYNIRQLTLKKILSATLALLLGTPKISRKLTYFKGLQNVQSATWHCWQSHVTHATGPNSLILPISCCLVKQAYHSNAFFNCLSPTTSSSACLRTQRNESSERVAIFCNLFLHHATNYTSRISSNIF